MAGSSLAAGTVGKAVQGDASPAASLNTKLLRGQSVVTADVRARNGPQQVDGSGASVSEVTPSTAATTDRDSARAQSMGDSSSEIFGVNQRGDAREFKQRPSSVGTTEPAVYYADVAAQAEGVRGNARNTLGRLFGCTPEGLK